MRTKKIISVALCFILLLGTVAIGGSGIAEFLSSISITVFAVSNGNCGTNLIWELDDNGLLTISGTGAMTDYDLFDKSPWYYCGEIKSVSIGSGVTSISAFAFHGCTNLISIVVDSKNTVYDSRDNCNAIIETQNNELFIGCKNTIIPDSVTSIGSHAFSYCTGLTSLAIPDSVTSIGYGAFSHCINITSIKVPDSVTSINTWAFEYCEGLTSITIPDSVTSIDSYAFYECTGLKTAGPIDSGCNIEFGWNESIPAHAFEWCKSLTSITIPNSVTSIGNSAFSICVGLTSIEIPDDVISIGNSAFSGCTNLTSIIIGSSVTSIGSSAFSRCTGLTSIEIPDSVTSIGYEAFEDCVDLTSIIIGSSVTSIGSSAFSGCTSLTSIEIPDNVTSIERYVFEDCTDLTSITIPNSVINIAYSAFDNCESLKKVYYTGSETEWNGISILGGNSDLKCAEIIFNCDNSADNKSGLTLKSTTPSNGATGVSYNDSLELTFNQPISNKLDFPGIDESEIAVYDYETDEKIYSISDNLHTNNIEFSDNKLTIGNVFPNIATKFRKYYVLISPNMISASADSDIKFSGINDKDTFSFTLGDNIGMFTQEHVTSDYEILDSAYEKDYLNKAGKALSGDDDSDWVIPGLEQNMIPQGITYYEAKNWFLISSYHKTEDSRKNNSAILALDADTGEFVAQFNLHTYGGEDCHIHFGGLAASKYNLYLTYYDSKIAYIPLSELDVLNGTRKDVSVSGSANLEYLMNGANTAYMSIDDTGVLWTGNFYCTLPEAIAGGSIDWHTSAGKPYNSIMLGYKLSGENSKQEWQSIKNHEDYIKENGTFIKDSDGNKIKAVSNYDYIINIPMKYDGIQGAVIQNGILYLSKAEWRPDGYSLGNCSGSYILAHKLTYITVSSSTYNSKSISVFDDNNWVKISNLSGGENICFANRTVNGKKLGLKMYSVYEASAQYAAENPAWYVVDSYTDVVWEMDAKKMLKGTKLGSVKCPVDVEIVDKSTGETVGRIVNNEVDTSLDTDDNPVIMEVDGDEKLFWLPAEGEYEVKLTGNDSGSMCYTLSTFGENAEITERINFYDMFLKDDFGYTSEISGETILDDMLVTSDGMIYIPNTTTVDNVAVIATAYGDGTVSDYEEYIIGDKVTVTAEPNSGSIFTGWYKDDKLISTEAKYSFVVKENTELVAKFEKINISITNRQNITVDYKSSVTLHSTCDVKGISLAWFDANTGKKVSDGNAYTVGTATSTFSIYAAAVDESGNKIDGTESATETVTVKSGFFDKIIAFFRGLFGSLPKYVDNKKQ